MMKDIEIARSIKKLDIREIGKKIGLNEEDLILYGNDKAKIRNCPCGKNGKLVLVTAISPTPYGEGKTTVSIGLLDALRKIKKNAIGVLREPSMGPVFGMKGGATGGGYSQVVPMEDINLHFTGDFHAITSANNLLCAAIDNHIYFGNELDIQEVTFGRCLDVNDRALREVTAGGRSDVFSITAASEIMALFCLATSLDDLKEKLGNIVIGYNSKKEELYAKDLNVEGAMLTLLKDAFLPNLVQTLEGNPVIIHGGPFANIAHGCNSIVATKYGLGLADYVITEAGFGADLGAEKFFDIKCRKAGLSPDAVVLVATIKALKYHGGVKKDDIYLENIDALKLGLSNLVRHIENMKKYTKNVVVCLNRYDTDLDTEIDIVRECCKSNDVLFSESKAYSLGGEGAIDVAEKVLEVLNNKNDFKVLYEDELSLVEKVNKVAKEIYRAKDVEFSEVALDKLTLFEEKGLGKLPICIAKTQYSFSDDAKAVGAPNDFVIHVRDVRLYNGAGFITVLLGDIMTMPGLSRKPNYEIIDVVDGNIIGLN
ncbi:MAG: formate--tetrahydrofolate ligase [Bacilli bacterium]|nr:formate--tetrahydrofolate ligase [Bacilli bacterium]